MIAYMGLLTLKVYHRYTVILSWVGLISLIFLHFTLQGNGGEHDREGVKWAVCGGMAGITSKFIVLPFDLIKKRMEVSSFFEKTSSLN